MTEPPEGFTDTKGALPILYAATAPGIEGGACVGNRPPNGPGNPSCEGAP